MDTDRRRRELGRFLRDRRDRLTPSEVGLAAGSRRRVPGLRREEVATLAGVGVTWYTMLENGTAMNASVTTLDAVADALRFSAEERTYLHRLAEGREPDAERHQLTHLSRAALDAIAWAPAYVITSRWMVLGWNRAMSVVWGLEIPSRDAAPFNIVTRMFEDPRLRAMHGDRFPTFARALVSMVRSAGAAHVADADYVRMVERLMFDPVFSAAWNDYEVARPTSTLDIVVESAAVGTFRYTAMTLDIVDGEHWLVMQLPDAESAERLRFALDSF